MKRILLFLMAFGMLCGCTLAPDDYLETLSQVNSQLESQGETSLLGEIGKEIQVPVIKEENYPQKLMFCTDATLLIQQNGESGPVITKYDPKTQKVIGELSFGSNEGETGDCFLPLSRQEYYLLLKKADGYRAVLFDESLKIVETIEDIPINGYLCQDRQTVVYVENKQLIKSCHLKTGKETVLFDNDTDGLGGGIWITDFSQNLISFSSTSNPLPGTDSFGYYDLLTGKSLVKQTHRTLLPHSLPGGKVFFSQEGAAAPPEDNVVLLLDAGTDSEKEIPLNSDRETCYCTVSENGKFVASFLPEESRTALTLYDGVSGQMLYQLDLPPYDFSPENSNQFAVSNDARWAAVFTGQNVYTYYLG
ncbi:hypothetical protein [Youxingia wuxianensis]|uniref:6-bladed beta-propeller n=1 Tax=Youxingia wuxianensis TaxID=2763678 RepID=A0A926IGN5_9FIRM|nr:hypothetical protein [Youxingia wuxianensis]MBC8585059.1 hypothetical protein [Youxingia wuxianensis]